MQQTIDTALSVGRRKSILRGGIGLSGILGALLALAVSPAVGQGKQARPTLAPVTPTDSYQTHSRSHVKPHAQTPARPVSQEDLADAVLDDTIDRLVEAGDAHFHDGEYNHAIHMNYIIVQGDPKDVEAYSNSAWLLWSTQRTKEALAILKAGLAANPDTFDMYNELGLCYSQYLHDPASAIPYYEKAVKLLPAYNTKHGGDPYFAPWNSLAHCYEKTNQWEKAVKTWETACNFLNDVAAPQNLARARRELAARQHTDRR